MYVWLKQYSLKFFRLSVTYEGLQRHMHVILSIIRNFTYSHHMVYSDLQFPRCFTSWSKYNYHYFGISSAMFPIGNDTSLTRKIYRCGNKICCCFETHKDRERSTWQHLLTLRKTKLDLCANHYHIVWLIRVKLDGF
jgi:hypothetical protein